MTPGDKINYLLSHPEEMLKKKPFTRGARRSVPRGNGDVAGIGEYVEASAPEIERIIVTQDRFLAELDPACHDVLFDENIPSITVKLEKGGYRDIEFKRTSVPFQREIVKKHVQHLCTYDLQFTLDNSNPSDEEIMDFATYKKYWKRRNMGGLRTKMVTAQKSVAEAGLLFYFDRKGQIKARLISYEDGYVICSHNDDNGDRLMECVYYKIGGKEIIDAYTDDHQYRYVKDPEAVTGGVSVWKVDPNVNGIPHGFQEIPLVTKRGKVAWDAVQTLIEVYEIIDNIFLVIQKRHGWGILYIKGTFSENAKKIAGSIILNDASLNRDGDAKYLSPPSPTGTIDTLQQLEDAIQKGAGATFILPKDISLSGDISGVAVEIAQSLDIEEALLGVAEWQNVADKMTRLFKHGLGKELVDSGIDNTAQTRFDALDISATFKVWKPRSETEYNTMLETMKGNGIISQKTAVERNTESAPDEELRIAREAEQMKAKEGQENG